MDSTPASLLFQLREDSNEEAWTRFVLLYTPMLYRWAERTSQSKVDAADLVQEVFVVLLRSLPSFSYDGSRSFRAWLHTVLRTKWCDWQRRHRRLPANDAGLSGAADDQSKTIEIEDAEFRTQLISRALELLTDEFGETTILAFRRTAIESRSATEVATELGLTTNAVYLARGRVMRRLRIELEGMWD